jgi:hypothetical protein
MGLFTGIVNDNHINCLGSHVRKRGRGPAKALLGFAGPTESLLRSSANMRCLAAQVQVGLLDFPNGAGTNLIEPPGPRKLQVHEIVVGIPSNVVRQREGFTLLNILPATIVAGESGRSCWGR